MRQLLAIALLILASVVAAAPVPKEARKPNWQFPTLVGTEWVYETAGRRNGLTTDTIAEVGLRRGDPMIHIRSTFECVIEGMETSTINATRLIVRDGCLWEMAGDAPGFLLLKFPPRVGDVWERKHTALAFDRTVTRVVVEERIKVPAGTFDCVKVETRAYTGDTLEWTETNWYAPVVGLVKSTGGPIKERAKLLKTFTPGPAEH
ncbi:hypothetical protein GobsT_44540 [Gemmata obscuriglobus]|uniref:DUF3108 domain-containing protein n=1 Tax=Gemmata obscuriglobus TaxID=114 RepID=A0A2Z3GW53_9BACT|nr:hypothetical protein [Gemmata obscuriglobus]AWM37558.1 hypothetical protein C1280_11420 [Gemmata obscuriglobus]QEG29656.1 hypothetical protein GobsT_44540 [Gemmata obscuriglobus]VTS08973.1 : DUF3108 [Gemmata obscuriglobus UQM 2246]